MATFTQYQSTVLKIVEKTETAMIYTRRLGFLTGTVTNIIADGWKSINLWKTTAEKVVKYIQTLQK